MSLPNLSETMLLWFVLYAVAAVVFLVALGFLAKTAWRIWRAHW